MLLTAYEEGHLRVDPSLTHSLPIPPIESRHASAILLSYFGRRKEVIKFLLTFHKAGRSFIITTNGLPGFLLTKHNNSNSFLYELKLSESFQIEAIAMMRGTIMFEEFKMKLDLAGSTDNIEKLLKIAYPPIYEAMLNSGLEEDEEAIEKDETEPDLTE